MFYKLYSLGCKVNSYETNAIGVILKEHGYKEANDENVDVIVINTCSVTATADQKSRQHIRKMMKEYPHAICAVMGCFSQGNYESIASEIKPHIIVGTSNRNKLVSYIEEYQKNKQQIVAVNNNPRAFSYEELGCVTFSENVRAYLKIQDGCDNFCSYCLIPYRRGRSRSRDFDAIINEAKLLVDNGYQEIVLTGIHVGGYGHDLINCSFSKLVGALLEIKGLYRLRISSIEESEIDNDLINLFYSKDNIAKHLHMPLQSGSDSVLKRMNRKYDKEQFFEKINLIKKALPDVAITTDVIVGFPGETDEEFEECYNFIKKCGFNMLHVFPFSAREGTAAWHMKNQVNPQVKKQRVARLIELSNSLWNDYVERFIGTEQEVLVEQFDENNKVLLGHTSNYLEVKIPSNDDKVGHIIKVKLEKSMIVSR